MFKKLLSNLPFNPSLITQVSFYARRMRKESALRRMGLVFLGLTMLVQMFAVISPPQSTLADSDNDILRGGFTSQSQAVAHCQRNDQNFQDILSYYRVSCDALANGATKTINSTDHNKKLDSLGRNPQGPEIKRTGKPTDEYRVPIGSSTYYMKNLWAWDSGASSPYQVIQVTNADNVTIMVMYSCGNIITIDKFVPPAPQPPKPPQPPVVPPQELSCSNLVMSVDDNSKVNLGDQVIVRGQASGKNVKPSQKVDMYYEYVDATTNKVVTTAQTLGLAFSGTTADDRQPHGFTADTPGQFLIRLIVKHDGTATAAGSASGNCIKYITVQKLCDEAKNGKDLEACTDKHKTAKNLSQNQTDANGKTAKAGDIIEYSLTVSNTGNVTVPKYVVEENISDVLDYADVLDLHGGTQDAAHKVTWPAVDIKAKQLIKQTITVKIKNPIPATPVSSSDRGHFDCVITNVYGDTIGINIDCPLAKTIEATAALPNTGPGTSLVVGFGLTTVVAYFFARSKLFATELDLVREDYNTSGSQ